jgi:mannose-6-phosphate isomerase-like protein (cupin superfamily)
MRGGIRTSAAAGAMLLAGCAAAPPAVETAAAPIVDVSNAGHYVWGEINDGWRLVDRPDLSVIQEKMAPGGKEVRHRHLKARQFFYVIAGEFTMELEGVRHTLSPRQGIEIPPGAAHQAMNLSGAPAEFVVTSMPNSRGDREEAPQ